MIDERLFAEERAAPLRFVSAPSASLAELRGLSGDGALLQVWQIASGELLAFPQRDLATLTEAGGPITEAGLDELADAPLRDGHPIPTLEQALDALDAELLVHIAAEEGFFGDAALGTELARILTERGLLERAFITSPSIRCLRAIALENEALYYGWVLDERLFGGPIALEDHPIFELLPMDRVAVLGASLATAANVEALQQRGCAVGAASAEAIGLDWRLP